MKPFVAIDFETANAKRSSACAVGLVRFDETGAEEKTFTSLIRPHPEFDYFNIWNTRVHGIRHEDVMDAPSWHDIHDEIVDFIGDVPLVAHNMAFDGYVLSDLSTLYGLAPRENQRLCTLRLARKLLAEQLEKKSLDLVFQHYFPGDTFVHHEAAADARACGRVFVRMQQEYGFDQLVDHRPKSANRPKPAGADPKELEMLLKTCGEEGRLAGETVVFTGAFSIAKRATLDELVVRLGGRSGKSITKTTAILVVGAAGSARAGVGISAKIDRAATLQETGYPITVMTEEEFFTFLRV